MGVTETYNTGSSPKRLPPAQKRVLYTDVKLDFRTQSVVNKVNPTGYRLAQSILQMGFVCYQEDIGGGEHGHIQDMQCMHMVTGLLWLAVEWPWSTSALAGPVLTLLAQTGVETTSLPFNISAGTIGSFWSGGALAGRRALTIESSPMSGCSQGPPHKPTEIASGFGSFFQC